ncbi:unnamed protein product [Caenorhabditis angaria]|uniref:GIY-YIG domain-containing protein n=1 Tax=Caenorhabditis angaria TaxID=860376 RepID=A0A9P1N0L9_9PELO|nr:unnamed protein product [Caenorhabditis angaria]
MPPKKDDLTKKFEKLQNDKLKEKKSYCYFFLRPVEIQTALDPETFRKMIFYIGRGTDDRIWKHINNIREKTKERDEVMSPKMNMVLECWEKYKYFYVVKVFNGIHKIDSKCRESVMITAKGLRNLTNKINGWEIAENIISLEDQKEYGERMLKAAFEEARKNEWDRVEKEESKKEKMMKEMGVQLFR